LPVLFDYITNARGTAAARAQTFSIVLRQQPYPTRLGGTAMANRPQLRCCP